MQPIIEEEESTTTKEHESNGAKEADIEKNLSRGTDSVVDAEDVIIIERNRHRSWEVAE